jgi:predicted TIM-barrel fold metal-dependent hydrolase
MTTTTKASGDAAYPVDDRAPLLVVSADMHVGPRPEELRAYCPKQYLEQWDAFAAVVVDQYNRAIEIRSFSDEYWEGRRRNQETAGHYDPHAWLRDMDRDGVAGGVIFHDSLNGQPFPFDWDGRGKVVPPPEAQELATVGRAMYNRWLADFCSVEPGRNIGLAQLPFWDVDATMKELEWAAEHGLGGVNFPAPGSAGQVQPGDRDMDRFYAACASLDMTLSTHIGALPQTNYGDATNPSIFHFALLDASEWGVRTVYQLIIFGIFERHPNLKLVLTEVPGVFWNEMCLKMDSLHLTPIRRPGDGLTRLPSEYAATNVWMGNSFQSRQEAVAAIDIGREDRFLWGSDYPHAEGTFLYTDDPAEHPRTRLSLANTYHNLPLEKVRKLVGSNALDAYPRLDASVLDQIAERVGMRPAEMLDAPDLDAHPDIYFHTGSLGFRTHGAWA